MITLQTLYAITAGLNHRFPDGNQPFQIMTRLLEEGGELAQQVNHFESTGIKRQKYGEPDRQKLTKEVRDVILVALQAAVYYGIEEELEASFALALQRLTGEGHIPGTPQA